MNIRHNIYFEPEAEIYCTDTEKTLNGHVMSFKEGVYLTVSINSKLIINLQYNEQHDVYIGGQAGLEFQSNGPKRLA
jgi:hypothetical protein